MSERSREVLRRLTPDLLQQLDLQQDLGLLDHLMADDVLSYSDVDRYLEPHDGDREAQVAALLSLLRRRMPGEFGPPSTLAALRRAVDADAPHLTGLLDRVERGVHEQQGQVEERPVCLHCSVLNDMYDVRDVTPCLERQEALPDDIFVRLRTTRKARREKVKLLLTALAKQACHASNVVSLFADALEPKYPRLSARARLARPDDIRTCKCRHPAPSRRRDVNKDNARSERRRLIEGYRQQQQTERRNNKKDRKLLKLVGSVLDVSPNEDLSETEMNLSDVDFDQTPLASVSMSETSQIALSGVHTTSHSSNFKPSESCSESSHVGVSTTSSSAISGPSTGPGKSNVDTMLSHPPPPEALSEESDSDFELMQSTLSTFDNPTANSLSMLDTDEVNAAANLDIDTEMTSSSDVLSANSSSASFSSQKQDTECPAACGSNDPAQACASSAMVHETVMEADHDESDSEETPLFSMTALKRKK